MPRVRRSTLEVTGRKAMLLGAVSVVSLAAGGYLYFRHNEGSSPPIMQPDGAATDDGWVVQRRTVDYEAILKSALAQEASFLTMTLKRDVVRDQHLKTSVRYSPFPASEARVRVKYHVEYPIGYVLRRFSVSGDADELVITLPRPSLIARPSVNIQSYEIIESGYLVDEKKALLELQKRIQPDAEKRAAQILRNKIVVPRSEQALRRFLEQILRRHAQGAKPPTITFRYR